MIDETVFRWVALELSSNACKFSPSSKPVRVSARLQKGTLLTGAQHSKAAVPVLSPVFLAAIMSAQCARQVS